MKPVRHAALIVLGLVLAGAAMRADLSAVRSEPNPEKRAKRALDHADKTLHAAEDAFDKGEWEQTEAALEEFRQAVNLSIESLKATGKNPRKSPGPFKKAEIRTRKLQRHLEDFLQKVSVEEREQLEPVRAAVQKVHEDLLKAVMVGWESKS